MKKELPLENYWRLETWGNPRISAEKYSPVWQIEGQPSDPARYDGEDFNPSYYVAYLEEKYGRPEKEQ